MKAREGSAVASSLAADMRRVPGGNPTLDVSTTYAQPVYPGIDRFVATGLNAFASPEPRCTLHPAARLPGETDADYRARRNERKRARRAERGRA